MGKPGCRNDEKNIAFAPNVKSQKQKALRIPSLPFPTTMTPKGWNTVAFAQTKLPLKSCLMVFIPYTFHWGFYRALRLRLFLCPILRLNFFLYDEAGLSRVSCYSSSTLHVIICCVIFLVVYTTLPNFSFMADILKQMLFAWVVSFFKNA